MHNIVHYTQYVRWCGPLCCYSRFSFEDLNGDCVDSVHGTRDVARQVQYLLDVDRLIKFFYLPY